MSAAFHLYLPEPEKSLRESYNQMYNIFFTNSRKLVIYEIQLAAIPFFKKLKKLNEENVEVVEES
jgi:hypothetical protein